MVNYVFLSVYFYSVPNLRFREFNEQLVYTSFGHVMKLYRGSSPRPIINYVTTDKSGLNWIKIGDMPSTGNRVFFCKERINKEGSKKSRAVYKGDIILSNSMSFGKPYILEIDGFIHDGWFVIRDYQNYIDKTYLCQLLSSDVVQNQYKSTAAGGVVKNISSDLVNSVKFHLPSIMEQRKIARFLELIDQKIEVQIKIIEDYKVLKKKISKQVIGSQKPNTHIYECLENNSSSSKESDFDEYTEGQFPIYGANGVIKHINSYLIDIPSISIVKDGAGVGRTRFLYGKYTVIGTLNYLTSKNGYDLLYLYYALDNLDFTKYIVGSGIPHIYFKDYKHEMIYIPKDEKTINKIVRCLSSLDLLIHNEQNLLLYLTKQKEYLLNNMFI